jgi:hypothetical protein
MKAQTINRQHGCAQPSRELIAQLSSQITARERYRLQHPRHGSNSQYRPAVKGKLGFQVIVYL